MTYSRPSSRLNPHVERTNNKRPQDLHLNGLPRFHPSNFPSPNPSTSTSSTVTTPASNISSPTLVISPRHQQQQHFTTSHHRQISDAQRHLHLNQREVTHLHRGNAACTPLRSPPLTHGQNLRSSRPTSPSLNPLHSPGPVTPLELEEHDGYLFATTSSAVTASADGKPLTIEAKNAIVDSYIHKETNDHFDINESSSSKSTTSRSPYIMVKRSEYKHKSNLSR